MTACDEARSRLLEADPLELRPTTDTPLAAHLRECPRCRAVARAILAEQATLAEALASLAPGRAPGEAWRAAPAGDPATRRRRPSRRSAGDGLRRTPRIATLVAAAAAVALLLVLDSHEPRPPVGPGEPAHARSPADMGPAPLVAASGARAFAVLETNDPDLAVVWFF